MLRLTKTENGAVRGFPGTDARITVFKGIPFAAETSGENRWRAPQPAADWDGVLKCYKFAPISMQKVPGLDPDTQQANQCIVLIKEDLPSGQTRNGAVPADKRLREKSTFIGAVAVRKVDENVYSPDGYIVLTSLVEDKTLSWTAPSDADYTIMYYYFQGTAQAASPAVKKSYTINYFDRRGVEALKVYLENNVLNDEALNEKIKNGDFQYFMDSL